MFKEIVNGIVLAFDDLENRLTKNNDSMIKCENSYLICELVQLIDRSNVAE